MTKKGKYVGRESGKSSTKWFGPSENPSSEAGKHGYGARTGDGKTTVLGKVTEVIFRKGKK